VPHPQARAVEVSRVEQRILEQIVRQQTNPQWLVTRAKIILRAASGQSNSQIAVELGLSRNTVCNWRERWQSWKEERAPMGDEGEDDKALRELLEKVLQDKARSGSPGKFSAEQIVQIIAIACEVPAENGYPISHWTAKEIAMEAVKRGVVESISDRQVGRFLKRGGLETPSKSLLVEHKRKRPGDI